MIKAICRQLELIHHKYVDSIFMDQIRFKDNRSFINVPLENIQYSSQRQNQDAGAVLNETVTAKIRYSEDLPFLNTALKYYILRLHTDNRAFFVGSPIYPAELTYTIDNTYVNLTFKATKPQ